MPERKVKVPFPLPNSPLRDGVDVPIKESTDRWTETTLEDGTVIRIKPGIIEAVRIEGEYDPEGNPAYALKVQPTTLLIAPEHLKRKAPANGKIQ